MVEYRVFRVIVGIVFAVLLSNQDTVVAVAEEGPSVADRINKKALNNGITDQISGHSLEDVSVSADGKDIHLDAKVR